MSARLCLKCDGTRAETRFRLSAKRTSPFKSAGASVQSTTGSRVVRISGSNAGYTMFRGSVKSTGYPIHSPVSPSLPSRASPCAIIFQLDSKQRICKWRVDACGSRGFLRLKMEVSGLGCDAVIVCVLATFRKTVLAGSNPAEAVGFFGRKNPQHAFLRRGSKAVCPVSCFTACKRTQK
jgi:hypothetical protein